MGKPITNLKQYILDYVNAARRRPAIASDPSELDNLEKAALTSFSGAFGATNAPIAPFTYEARTILLSSATVSERVEVLVPFPMMVVGVYPSLSVLTSGAGTGTPSLNDIDVTLDLNNKDFKTAVNGNTSTSATATTPTRDGQFVTLAALGTGNSNGARLLGWEIPYRTATIGATFRWKQGSGVYHDTIVSLSLFTRPMEEE